MEQTCHLEWRQNHFSIVRLYSSYIQMQYLWDFLAPIESPPRSEGSPHHQGPEIVSIG